MRQALPRELETMEYRNGHGNGHGNGLGEMFLKMGWEVNQEIFLEK